MPAEFYCPNEHLVIYDGIGSDGTIYNCKTCRAEKRQDYQHTLPEHLRHRPFDAAAVAGPMEVRTVAVPPGPVTINIPLSDLVPDAAKEPETGDMITVRELADRLGGLDLRQLLPSLRKAGIAVNTGADVVPADLEQRMEFAAPTA